MNGVLGNVFNRLRALNHQENNTENRQENQGKPAGVKRRELFALKSAQKADERFSPIPAHKGRRFKTRIHVEDAGASQLNLKEFDGRHPPDYGSHGIAF